jgi:DNA-binding response OmpR family regulator
MCVLLVEDDPTTSKSIEMMLTHANLNVYSTDMCAFAVSLVVGELRAYHIPLSGCGRLLSRIDLD